MQEKKQGMTKHHSWCVQIVRQLQRHYGEEMMKVPHCVTHVVYSKLISWLTGTVDRERDIYYLFLVSNCITSVDLYL